MTLNIAAVRDEFPITKTCVFLNHAAASPISQPVARAVQALLQDQLQYGNVHAAQWEARTQQARESVAQLMNSAAKNIAFMRSTYDGLALAAHGIDWQSGDNIVIPLVEFPTNTYPWMNLATKGVELRRVPVRADGTFDADTLRPHVDARTRIVAVSWVQFSSGFRCDLAPIAQLCHDHDALFVVDVIQGLGALQFDFASSGADLVCAGAHKFLLGPHGVGVACVSERAMQRLQVATVGWLSVNAPFEFRYALDLLPDARRYEPGTNSTMGIHGLGAAVDLFLQHNPHNIEQHVLGLRDYLADKLLARGYRVLSPHGHGQTSGILILQHAAHDTLQLKQRLDAAQIITAVRAGGIRVSPHFYNTVEDIEQLLAVLP